MDKRVILGTFSVCLFLASGRALANEAPRATGARPWLGVTGASYVFGDKPFVTSSLGAELGVFPVWRLRVAARLLFPVTQRDDYCRTHDVIYIRPSGVYTCEPSEDTRFAAALSAGVNLLDSEHARLSPGLLLMRTDRSAHGTLLGASLPFDWMFSNGLGLGAELGAGAALGQTVFGRCRNHVVADCVIGSRKRVDKYNALAIFGSLSLTWAL